MSELFLDFETRSRLDLRKVGAHRYAEDASTSILCASVAVDGGALYRWTPGDTQVNWARLAEDRRLLVVAHNAEFERLVLKHKLGVDLPPERFRCTAAQAARAGLPRNLDEAGRALGLTNQKDAAAGKRLISKLSKPRRNGEFWEREDAADDFEDMETYNAGDVLTMRELRRSLPQLSDAEQALWELTVRMNDRGFVVDIDAARRMEKLAAEEYARLAARWVELTGVAPGSPRAARTLGLKSLAKVAVRHALRRPDLPPKLREALLLRQRIAKSSVKKLAAFFARTQLDGRLRGSMVYAGAERTARWSARGVQPHNFPRGLGPETDLAFQLLEADALGLTYDDIMRTLSEMLKGLLLGPFLVGDYGQIEARTLAVVAGQTDLVEGFEQGVDVYCQMASDIYGQPITKSDYDETLHMAKRQLGKVAILGCGYGLGWRKFVEQLDKDFDVTLDPDTAERVVNTYRERYPAIPRFWQRLENLWRQAVRQRANRLGAPGFPYYAGLREFAGRRFAYVELPNGRPMYYYRPDADRLVKPFGWTEGQPLQPKAAYFGRSLITHKWEMTPTYGGKLTENVVQATARDVMAEAMLALDRAGFPVVLTVHDEIVVEAPASGLKEFESIMARRPAWLPELPVAVEAFATRRYRK